MLANSQWGLYCYRRTKAGKRMRSTLIQKFDNAPDARLLLTDWRGTGQVYIAPCDERTRITAQGKKRMTEHLKNASSFKIAPDKNWQYVPPVWNAPKILRRDKL